MTTGPEIETATTTGAETTGATTIEVAMMIGAMIGGMTGIATTTAVMTDAAMIAMRTAEIGRAPVSKVMPLAAFHALPEASTSTLYLRVHPLHLST